MPAGLDPITNADVYDTIVIAGIASPGKAEIKGADRPVDWDVKKGPGTSGSTTTYRGESTPADFTIKFTLWKPAHFAAWDDFRKLFRYDPKKKKDKAITLEHPILADNGIRACVCKRIGELTHEGGGLFSYTVALIEFRPPKPTKPATPPAAETHYTETNTPQATAQTAQDQQLAALLAQAGLS